MKDCTFTADRLLALYDRVAEAEDAIPRLRRFVLDLAVRGKLVEQDPSDEPAAELLKRIACSAAHQPARRGKQRDTSAANALEELPFEAPDGWTFAALGQLVRVLNGRAYKQQELLPSGTPVLRVGNLFTSNHWYYSDLELDDDKYCEAGDLIYAWSASFGPFIWDGPRSIFHYHIWKLPLVSETDLSKRYLFLFLQQKTREIKEAGHGISMVHMTKEKMEKLIVPLPPLAEQRRIVAKVDELMALCDRLEGARAGREAVRDRLTAATLTRLTAPETDAETFPTHARFTLQTLPTLTTRPDQIKTLRQTILNLAVQGKLEPFSAEKDLAEQFQALRESRISACLNASEKIKVVSAFEQIEAQWREEPDAPRFVTTLCACRFITKGTTPAPNDLLKSGHVPFLKVYNIVDNKLDFAYRPTFISPVVHNGALARSIVKPGDVLMNIVGPPLGKVALVTDEYPEWNINQALAYFRPMPFFSSRFLALILTAPVTIEEVLKETRGTVGQDNLSLEQVRSLRIPFVSEVQQHRIVAKVDALMALCDQLESSLTTATTTRSRLLESLLNEALNGAQGDQPETAA